MSFVTVGGRKLEARLIPGDASLAPLVFLHEGLGCVSLWRDFPDKVARRTKARVLVYSRQGYGKSDALDGPRNVRFMHDEALTVLPDLLDIFEMERPILVGHSDGASIALIHAANYPQRTAGLVLMAPHVFVEQICRESIARISGSYLTSGLRERLARHHEHVDDAFYGWSRIWLDDRFRQWSLTPEIPRLECPVLLIQGENDEYGTLAQVDAIADGARAAVGRLILPECGHAPHRDHEQSVLDAIAMFVEAQARA